MIGAAQDEAWRIARQHVEWCISTRMPLSLLMRELGEDPDVARRGLDAVIAAVARAWLATVGEAPDPLRLAA